MITNKQNNISSDQINFYEIFNIIFTNKSNIAIYFLLIFSLSNIFIYFINDTFKSEATLMLRNDTSSFNSSLPEQFGGMASFAGLSLSNTSNNKGALAEKIIDSRSFTKILVDNYDILIPLFAAKSYNKKTKQLTIDIDKYDVNTNKWVRKDINPIPSYEEVNELLKNEIIFRKDKNQGFYNLSFEHISPKFSHYLVSIIIKEINSYIQKDELRESEKALDFLNKQSQQINYNELSSALNNLIEAQLKKKMFAEIHDDYVFKIVDGPTKAEKQTNPNRLMLSLIASILSIILSFFIVVLSYYLRR